MKIAFSNIAWDAAEEPDVLPLLKQGNIKGIEIAPTKYWPGWAGATPEAVKQTASALAQAGFAVPSLQAILFERKDLKLFGSDGDRMALLAHIETVAAIAQNLGAKTLVFGSPSNRDPGELGPEDAMRAAIPVLRAAGQICANHGVWLGIEANPAAYGCRFVTRWFEAASLVRQCNSPGVRFHLDAACTALAGDDLAEAVGETKDILAHVHISEPHLGTFDQPSVDHSAFADALRSADYGGWCSVEMRRAAEPLTAIQKAVEMARVFYG